MYSNDLRWRIISLIHIYDLDIKLLSELFGPKCRSIQRWYSRFLKTGSIDEKKVPQVTKSRWERHILADVQKYMNAHPTFYIEELQIYLKEKYPYLKNVSESTICRALNFDLQLTRKKLTKAARESVPHEIDIYYEKLLPIYSYPEQLLFIDETSKDGRDAFRRYARSKRGTKAVVKLPFSRGERVSVLAALDHKGFLSWKSTRGTFTRKKFHDAFSEKVVPFLNPWPLPRSIVIMDNAKIHLYNELVDSIHQCGARLIFLPPYSLELNPIEVCFGLLKRWIQKHANLVFPLYPELVLDVAMPTCIKQKGPKDALELYGHCGYDNGQLRHELFESLKNNRKNDDSYQ